MNGTLILLFMTACILLVWHTDINKGIILVFSYNALSKVFGICFIELLQIHVSGNKLSDFTRVKVLFSNLRIHRLLSLHVKGPSLSGGQE